MRRLGLALACLGFLAGCATLPEKQDGKAVAILPIKHTITDSGNFYVGYQIYFDGGKSIRVSGDAEYAIISDLVPGKYYITEVQPFYLQTNRYLGKRVTSVFFECEAGGITVIPKEFVIEMKRDPYDGVVKQYYNFRDLPADEKEKLAADLAKLKNYDEWKIIE